MPRTKTDRNAFGSILQKEVTRNGQKLISYNARKRFAVINEEGKREYHDLTKRFYSLEDAENFLTELVNSKEYTREKKPPNKTTRRLQHGHTSKKYNHKSITYVSYEKAKERCENPNVINYKWYGGRGIEFRFASFQEFLAEIGERPSKEYSVDRIDVNGHYEKGNVRWVTKNIQAQNKRKTISPLFSP